MEAYRPKIGEYVRVELYGVVRKVEETAKETSVMLDVKVNEREEVISIVPMQAVEPFNANKEQERNVST